MKKSYNKDIWCSIKKSKKRFLSLLTITVLGVTVLTGIYAACQDLYYSADRFYDEQNLYDIRILSTLGLTQEDVDALADISSVEKVEGSYSETVYTDVKDTKATAAVTTLSPKKLNLPYTSAGTLPTNSGEVAVTQRYLDDTKKKLGDTLYIEEKKKDSSENDLEDDEETPSFSTDTYKITAVVVDPMDISNNEATAFRSSASVTDYAFYITLSDVNSGIYTSVYLSIAGLKPLDSYSEEYRREVDRVSQNIESKIKEQREKARYNSITRESRDKIAEKEAEMNQKFSDAEQEFTDGRKKIEDAKEELTDGEDELAEKEAEAAKKIADARKEIEANKMQLNASEKELADGEAALKKANQELEAQSEALAENKKTLAQKRLETEAQLHAAEQALKDQQVQLGQSQSVLAGSISELQQALGDRWPAKEWNTLVDASCTKALAQMKSSPDQSVSPEAIAAETAAEQQALAIAIMQTSAANPEELSQRSIQAAINLGILNASRQLLETGKNEFQSKKADALAQLADAESQLSSGEAKLEAGRKQLEDSRSEIESGKAKISAGRKQLSEGEAKLNKEEANAKAEIASARKKLSDGRQELQDNEANLSENEETYQKEKTEAEQKIKDAYDKLDDLEMTTWFIQDRTDLASYTSLKSDLSSIESIGKAFPVLFLIVAFLTSLTTMTRMIEEERGLIGAYKALGYSSGAIYKKYLVYAVSACILGGLIGDLFGFIALPKIILVILQSLYVLPNVYLRFDWLYGIGGIGLFLIGIAGATILACKNELRQMPASLMRPKSPAKGTRVLLERIPFIWNRLRFLNKVTVRNLFRYKKRFFMTIFGIMGCTALVLAGFAIKDSVTDLLPKQYSRIYQYDLMTVVNPEDNGAFLDLVKEDKNIGDYLNLLIDSMNVYNEKGHSESAQVMIIPGKDSLESYINTENIQGKRTPVDASGIYLTRNAAELLGVKKGDTVSLQNSALKQGEFKVADIMENYLGNNVFINKDLYQSVFSGYEPNAILAHLTAECKDPVSYAEDLLSNDMVLSSVSKQGLKDSFSDNFQLINAVVYILIILAAGLAFVVLFTLSNTNISERMRELATTKVLGFYDKEVHSYVNKETLILTIIGIVVGLPLGRFLSGLLTGALKMPSIYFATHVNPVSYLYAVVISFFFALMVNLMTNRTLDHIDMIDALKSVE